MGFEESSSIALSKPHIVGVSGNWTRPSRTRTLVQAALHAIESRGLGRTTLLDLVDTGSALGQTTDPDTADAALREVMQTIQEADALVVGTAVYKASYTGLFKHLFDLFDLNALARKPVLLTATGASAAHSSVIDYHLRPLFLFFDAAVVTRGVYGVPGDFEASESLTATTQSRVNLAVDELAALLGTLSA